MTFNSKKYMPMKQQQVVFQIALLSHYRVTSFPTVHSSLNSSHIEHKIFPDLSTTRGCFRGLKLVLGEFAGGDSRENIPVNHLVLLQIFPASRGKVRVWSQKI